MVSYEFRLDQRLNFFLTSGITSNKSDATIELEPNLSTSKSEQYPCKYVPATADVKGFSPRETKLVIMPARTSPLPKVERFSEPVEFITKLSPLVIIVVEHFKVTMTLFIPANPLDKL